jgi:hypothetical protein
MSSQIVEQVQLDFLPELPVIVQQHEGQMSSDAGLLPIAEFDRRWNYTARMAACLNKPPSADSSPKRCLSQALHQPLEMLRQRLFGILAGHEDCNDHDRLRYDPIIKMVADRTPDDEALASQPTLCRFENSVTPSGLQQLIDFTIATGIERLKEKHGGSLPASITLDLDATDDPTHGHQQLTLFHGYYGQYQYFPLIISEPTTKHVFLAWLRPGTVHASLGAEDDLMRVVNALRKERPDIQIHVRGDGGFGLPKMYELCEKNGLTYTFGFTTNNRLKTRTQETLQRAIEEYARTKQKQRLFDCFQYKCDSWDASRTVVAKSECHVEGTNQRFVVTNRSGVTSSEDAMREYDDYIQRGESEHRMDELKNGLHMDRLSCHRFMANFFRLLIHVAAINLLNALRQSPLVPQVLQVGQPCTWQCKLIKVAAVVVQTTRRIVVKIAANWPYWSIYQSVAARAVAFNAGPVLCPVPS